MRPPRMDTAQLTLARQPFDDSNFLFELKRLVVSTQHGLDILCSSAFFSSDISAKCFDTI